MRHPLRRLLLHPLACALAVAMASLPAASADTPAAVKPQAPATAAPAGTRLLRFPDICGERIVFTYAGDLWTVPTAGGTATRLTAGPGLEQSARYSPDCHSIAFTGEYGGDDQVYVVDAAGGEPRQLTYYPTPPVPARWGFDHQVYGWSPDGGQVLFRSIRESWEPGKPKLFVVPAAGGLASSLPMPTAGAGRFSPDGKQLVYSPDFRDFRTWNRYHGGWAETLYIYDFAGKSARKVIADKFSDRDPIWIGGAIYYLSDRDNHGNLYRYDVASGQTTQLTHHLHADARWASGDAQGRIVYEYDGGLRLYDTRDNSDRALTVNVPSDLPATRAGERSVTGQIEGADLSPNGKRALVVARGEVFNMPLEHGVTLDITHTPGAHEREAAWSPDGSQAAYISDQSGEEAVWVRSADGKSAPRQLTRANFGRLYAPRWSPDGKHLAFTDSGEHLRIVDTAGNVVEVAHDRREMARDYAWSPGGHYLAYTLEADNRLPAVFVYDLAGRRSLRASAAPFAADSPAFSPDGQYLYFLSQREWTPLISGVEWDYASTRSTEIYALALRKNVASPFPLRNDQATGEGKDKPAAKTAKPAAVDDRIDADGLAQRMVRVPLDPDNYGNLNAIDGALLYTVDAPRFYAHEGPEPAKARLVRYDFSEREEHTLAEDKSLGEGYALASGGSALLYPSDKAFKRIDLGDKNAKPKDVKIDGLYAYVDPKAEYAEILHEVWRRYRDYFYAQNMNGYDWPALRKKYEAQLAYVGDRTDLNYLLGQMLAELSNSHAYVSGGDLGLPARPHTGLLGATFALDKASGRYRIAHIYRGDNAEERYRSPLTELGVEVKEGDYLLAVNGQPLSAPDNPYRLLRTPPGQPLQLTVNNHPSDAGARTVLVQPVDSEHGLVYDDWVAGNRDYVARKSGGKLGYLHIPDMGGDGIREFIKWYYPQIHKQGLVVDVRGNGGGNVSAMIIERLSRKLLGLSYARGNDDPDTYPRQTFTGYLAALANGTTASDGDIFSHMFQQAHLGPVIGSRTWGGVVGINDWGPLIDGGTVNVPQFATASVDGHYVIEGEGVTPDIDVPIDVAKQLQGDDVQLDSAIDYLDKQIQAKPPVLPTRPADPDKAPTEMKPAPAAP